MKPQSIAIVMLSACTLFAAPAAVTTTTTETTTTTDGNTTKVTRTTTTVTGNPRPLLSADAILPEDGGYSYIEYDGVRVPYYKGYYYIDDVWVWRGSGKPPFPPPRFRPILPTKGPKAAPVKPAPVKRAPAKSVPRRGSQTAAPRPPRRPPAVKILARRTWIFTYIFPKWCK